MPKISQRYSHFFYDSSPQKIANSRSIPAIILLNYDLNIVYHNREAAQLLNSNLFPHDISRETAEDIYLPPELLAICNKFKASANNPNLTTEAPLLILENTENSHSYLCLRVFPMSPSATDKVNRYSPYFIILIEKIVCPKSIKLSNRETDVLKLLFIGLSNKEIADQLCIAPYTVEDHIKNLIRKFNVKSRLSIITKFLEYHK